MAESIVVIFGAGATKACNGPLTNEILPRAVALRNERGAHINREGMLDEVEGFLREIFHLPARINARQRDDYPPLPLLLSVLDTAVDRKQNLASNWDPRKLADAREALEYVIFAVLEHDLRQVGRGANSSNYYHHFLEKLWDRSDNQELSIISLNYDIIADNALIDVVGTFPDYGCDIATPMYRQHLSGGGKFGKKLRPKLLKPHGSLNWLYCPACQRLDLGVSRSGRTIKLLDRLYQQQTNSVGDLEHRYSCRGSPCADCRTPVRPVMITPTHLKDYRNPHVARVWYEAARALRRADRVFIVGYSLPSDDVDVVYLLKSNMAHLSPSRTTIVEYAEQAQSIEEHEAGKRYRALFGANVGWTTDGFARFAAEFGVARKPRKGPLRRGGRRNRKQAVRKRGG